jgi:hypothetical protein
VLSSDRGASPSPRSVGIAQDALPARGTISATGRAALAALACLTLFLVGAPRFLPAAASSAADTTARQADATCGEAATRWSEATANGVRARLVRLVSDEPSIAADPPEYRRVAARLTIDNESANALPLGLAAFALVACDGTIYPAVADPDRRPPPDDLPAGRSALGWVTFVVPDSVEPALLVLRIDVGETCQASFGFPLVLPPDAAATELVATAEPLARFLDPCEGGSATGGAVTESQGGAGSAIGADGGDGVDDDAVGGDGCPGQDAIGSGAIGGDGGDGGDADGSGGEIGDAATDCQAESAA